MRDKESNRKHGRFVSRFEHTCSTSPPSHLKDFHYKPIPPDHLVPQHLQGVHTRTLGLTSPSFVHVRTTHVSKLACQGRTSTPSSHKNTKQHEPASSPPQIQDETLSDLCSEGLIILKRGFLNFSPQHLYSFSHTKLSFSLLYSSYKIFIVRSVCW